MAAVYHAYETGASRGSLFAFSREILAGIIANVGLGLVLARKPHVETFILRQPFECLVYGRT